MTQTSHIKVINKKVSTGQDFFFLMHNRYWIWNVTIQKGDLMCQQEGHLFWFPSRFYTVRLKLDFKNESIKHFWIFYNIFYPFNTFEICLIFFSVHSLSYPWMFSFFKKIYQIKRRSLCFSIILSNCECIHP